MCGTGLFCEPWSPTVATLVVGFFAVFAAIFTIQKMKMEINQSAKDAAASIGKMQDQINQSETQARINEFLQLAIKKEELLLEWTQTPKITHMDLVKLSVIQRVENGQLPRTDYRIVQNVAHELVELHRHDQPGEEPKLLHWASPIWDANVILHLLGEDAKAKVQNADDDFFDLRVSLENFSATYAQLVFLVQEMVNLGYSFDAAKVLLGTSHFASSILYKLGFLEEGIFIRSRTIVSLGGFDKRVVKANSTKDFLEELKSLKLISNDLTEENLELRSGLDNEVGEIVHFVTTLESPSQFFERRNGNWSIFSESRAP